MVLKKLFYFWKSLELSHKHKMKWNVSYYLVNFFVMLKLFVLSNHNYTNITWLQVDWPLKESTSKDSDLALILQFLLKNFPNKFLGKSIILTARTQFAE